MAFSQKNDVELQMKARKDLNSATDPLTKLRLQCLTRGAKGIKGFSRQFRIMDDDGNKRLSQEEFAKGCTDFGVNLTNEEVITLFETLDKDASGSVEFGELLEALRPPMSSGRVNIIKRAFEKMDQSGDGVITVKDLKGVYNARLHPKYKSGEWEETDVFQEFLKTFELPGSVDAQVTWEEFLNYYSGISASVDGEAYFDLMMRNSFKL